MMDLLLRMSSTPSSSLSGDQQMVFSTQKCIWVNGPIIVGAGPSGLSVGACLRSQGVPFTIIERSSCIASLWQHRTYDRLKLHLPKQFCQLPNLSFPDDFPEYPTRTQFITYLENYATKFDIHPQFNESVSSAEYDNTLGLWRVRTVRNESEEIEYVCRWVVVATGENSEAVIPMIDGLNDEFNGKVVHVCDYKSGEEYDGKRVVVIGCGNSGMEVSLDLANHNAIPSMVCRSDVHVLPREVYGKSTFEIAVLLMKWLPIWIVDKILLFFAWMVFGNVEKYGLKIPEIGPMELKATKGKTPVLDIGAIEKIKSGEIKVVKGIKKFHKDCVELVDGTEVKTDAVVLATGYKSNVPKWLKERDEDRMFDQKIGFPTTAMKGSEWKGKSGLYAVGFTRRGLSGLASDAVKIAEDIGMVWKNESTVTTARKNGCCLMTTRRLRRCISTF